MYAEEWLVGRYICFPEKNANMFVVNRRKSTKIDENRRKSTKIDKNWRTSTKIDENRRKSTKIDENRRKLTKRTILALTPETVKSLKHPSPCSFLFSGCPCKVSAALRSFRAWKAGRWTRPLAGEWCPVENCSPCVTFGTVVRTGRNTEWSEQGDQIGRFFFTKTSGHPGREHGCTHVEVKKSKVL
jgi:hypothetical protein